jgi:type IV secretion system protein VirB10
MPFRIVALFLIASVCAAQTPTAPPSTTITVPPATLIALRLISSIKSKSTKRGDPVRAIVAFPLVVGTQVAIPAGTYVEGVVDKVNAHPSGSNPATVQLRFTSLLFANGYSAPLVATNTQANNVTPVVFSRSTDLLADARDGAPYLGEGFGASGQFPPPPPQLPPLPSNGPSPAALAGIGIGVAGIVVLAAAIGHHRAANADYVLFDTGWQFQMALQEPLTLDAAQVSAAALPH